MRARAMGDVISLEQLGWDDARERQFEPFRAKGLVPARVARQERLAYFILGAFGELTAKVPGKWMRLTRSRSDFPGVGDWVAVELTPGEPTGTLREVLSRRSRISRLRPGTDTDVQILAANVDVAFLVSSLDGGRNYNLATIERQVSLAFESSTKPVILLNKCDLVTDSAERVAEVQAIASGVAVYAVSAFDGRGFDDVGRHVAAGITAVFLGRSGVGKSAIINRLLGRTDQPVGDVRANDLEGRHTTTWREMLVVPTGGVVIDTPGIREIALWGDREGIQEEFPDIDALSLGCRFTDCRHKTEPGCAVLAAVAEGKLTAVRLERFYKLRVEEAVTTERQVAKKRLNVKARSREMSRKRANANPADHKRRSGHEAE